MLGVDITSAPPTPLPPITHPSITLSPITLLHHPPQPPQVSSEVGGLSIHLATPVQVTQVHLFASTGSVMVVVMVVGMVVVMVVVMVVGMVVVMVVGMVVVMVVGMVTKFN